MPYHGPDLQKTDSRSAFEGAQRLRALGTLPQRDRLVTCVDAALGVSSMRDLASVASELRIATSPDDGVNLIGLAAHRMLTAVGLPAGRIASEGGTFLCSERPFEALTAFRDGRANVVIHEAVMMPVWQRVADNKEATCLDVDAAAIDAFAQWD